MMERHFQKRRLIVYINIIKDRRDHSYDAENLTCDEVTERKDYIRMDQKIIRTFAKMPNEQYSFDVKTLHFSAYTLF